MFTVFHRLDSAGRRDALSRWLWVCMLAVHAPALLAVWRLFLSEGVDAVRLSSFLGLSAAALFFVLKILGVRVLNFERSRRSVVAVVIGIALLHANAIDVRVQNIAIAQEIPVAGSILLAAGLSCVQRVFQTALSGGRQTPRQTCRAGWTVRPASLQARQLLPVGCLCAPRAPPFSYPS